MIIFYVPTAHVGTYFHIVDVLRYMLPRAYRSMDCVLCISTRPLAEHTWGSSAALPFFLLKRVSSLPFCFFFLSLSFCLQSCSICIEDLSRSPSRLREVDVRSLSFPTDNFIAEIRRESLSTWITIYTSVALELRLLGSGRWQTMTCLSKLITDNACGRCN